MYAERTAFSKRSDSLCSYAWQSRRQHSSTLVSSASLCHLHDISWYLYLSDVVSPLFPGVHENIIILRVYGIGHEFQFLAVEFDFLVLCVPITPYPSASFSWLAIEVPLIPGKLMIGVNHRHTVITCSSVFREKY